MDGVLDFQFADLKSAANNKEHFTHEISNRKLFVRRGQTFNIALHFKRRGYREHVDDLVFIMETGPEPSEANGTMAKFSLSNLSAANSWSATVTSNTMRSLEVALFTPPSAVIGTYKLSLQISSEHDKPNKKLGTFVLLFNPWCSDDAVFLHNDAHRQEYVMNETGVMFHGHANYIKALPWMYGQFEEGIIDICLKLLDRSVFFAENKTLDVSKRNSPVYVSRVVSSMINSNDENGVVEGNWSGKYEDGINPTEWNSSVAILRQWATSEYTPVKYGQCWVFAAVMCTVLRCLGIPTRVVTNYESAHDTESNLDVDVFYDKNGKELEEETYDSIWNFHVWNECWMVRKDLPSGHDGWQIVDATPQETSEGKFCCGPASVKAIKEGDVSLNFDGRFVFAEVNANVVSWVVDPETKKREKAFSNSRAIGKHISTKSVGVNGRDDITSTYKYEEGSAEEKQVLEKANPGGSLIKPTRKPFGAAASTVAPRGDDTSITRPLSDKQIQLKFKMVEKPVIGTDIRLVLVASNQGKDDRNMKMNINVEAIMANGVSAGMIMQKTFHFALAAKADKAVPIQLPYMVYRNYLSKENTIRVLAAGELESTGEQVLLQEDITLSVPSIQIEVLGSATVGLPFTVKLSFLNSHPQSIYKGFYTVEGEGLIKGKEKIEAGVLRSGDNSLISLQITPFEAGKKQLKVTFTSDNAPAASASKTINVLPAKPGDGELPAPAGTSLSATPWPAAS